MLMESEIKIGLISCFYKASSNYHKDCLDSIFNQTDKEFIFYMFSDDYDMEIPKDKNVKYEKVKNLTSSEIKARGAKKAFLDCMDYICFVDSDDFMDINRIKIIKNYLKKNRVDLLIHNLNSVDKNGKIIKRDIFNFDEYYLNEFYWEKNNSGFGNTIYKTRVLKEFLPFPKRTYSMDWDIIFTLSLGRKVFTLKKSLLNYRQHGNNIVGINSKMNIKRLEDILKKRSLHYKILKSRFKDDEQVYKIVDSLYNRNTQKAEEIRKKPDTYLRAYNKKSKELIWWELL